MLVGAPSLLEIQAGGPDLRGIVLDVLGDRDIPVLGNVNIGHAGPNLPVPIGVRAAMDAERACSVAPGTGGQCVLTRCGHTPRRQRARTSRRRMNRQLRPGREGLLCEQKLW